MVAIVVLILAVWMHLERRALERYKRRVVQPQIDAAEAFIEWSRQQYGAERAAR